MIVNTREELEALPDGTIITWLRIPSDSTSEAVAFVRHQDEANNDIDGRPLEPSFVRTVWISPGGWDPQTVESAGVNFPVVAFTDPSNYGPSNYGEGMPELMAFDPPQFGTLMSGGTYPRDEALRAAARVLGDAHDGTPLGQASSTLAIAERFEEWLSRDDDGSHPPYLTAADLDLILDDVRDTFSDGTVMSATVDRIVATVAAAVIRHAGVPK